MRSLPLLLTCLLVTSPGYAEEAERRAVIFEPCNELFGQPLAHGALERVAHERSFALERARPQGDISAWLAILDGPPAALYVHTLSNRDVIAVACYGDRRSRDNALDALASDPATHGLPVQPWTYATAEREISMIAFELRAMSERFRNTETIVYLHREGDPRTTLEAPGFRVSREHDSPQPPVNHFLFVKRFFRQWLEDAHPQPVAIEPPPGRGLSALPEVELWPEALSVVLPIDEIWITVRNAGTTPLEELTFDTLLSPERLRVRATGRLPRVLRPGAEVDVPLVVETQGQLADDAYVIPILFGARAGKRTYERYGELEVVVDHPPQITAPSSVEFARGETVEILTRDASRRSVHLEAMLPEGIELRFNDSGSGEIVFSERDIPGVPVTTVTLVAWAGDDRQRARLRTHEIEIVGGDIPPPPRITQIAYGLVLLFVGFVYLRERLARRA